MQFEHTSKTYFFKFIKISNGVNVDFTHYLLVRLKEILELRENPEDSIFISLRGNTN